MVFKYAVRYCAWIFCTGFQTFPNTSPKAAA